MGVTQGTWLPEGVSLGSRVVKGQEGCHSVQRSTAFQSSLCLTALRYFCVQYRQDYSAILRTLLISRSRCAGTLQAAPLPALTILSGEQK